MTREELIVALEAATGPDRALDAYIGEYLGITLVDVWEDFLTYTASIDAALTLMPAHMSVVWFRISSVAGFVNVEGQRGQGATPAISFCIAALKVRAE